MALAGQFRRNRIWCSQVQSIVTAAVRDVVGLDVSLEAPLAACGLDSLAAVELRGVLSWWASCGAGSPAQHCHADCVCMVCGRCLGALLPAGLSHKTQALQQADSCDRHPVPDQLPIALLMQPGAGGQNTVSWEPSDKRLCRALGVDLPATVVFDFPSIAALTRLAHSLLGPPAAAAVPAHMQSARCVQRHCSSSMC